ncbi:MAG: transcriptional repressor [Rhizobiales bacterium]|nr:transcriptional repressor [Hyphomicrobiales bacterium]
MHPTAFPKPGHDHSHCTRELLMRAEQACAASGARLTPLRRKVLKSVAESHHASGAYDIIERLARTGPRPAPISIYRALEFLQDQGLVHKIESRNAFVACTHGEHNGDAVMLICSDCGIVAEMDAGDAVAELTSRAAALGFSSNVTVVEMTGCCGECGRDA